MTPDEKRIHDDSILMALAANLAHNTGSLLFDRFLCRYIELRRELPRDKDGKHIGHKEAYEALTK